MSFVYLEKICALAGSLRRISLTRDPRKLNGMLDHYRDYVISGRQDSLTASKIYVNSGYFSLFTPRPSSRNIKRFENSIRVELIKRDGLGSVVKD